MHDQAYRLRELTNRNIVKKADNQGNGLRILAVTSGKGGVGKTNVVVNLAISLAKIGKRVMILDADLGLANIDVLMGLVPKFTLYEVLRGEKLLDDIILTGPYDLKVLPGGSGIQELANLDYYQRERLISALRTFESDVDFLIIDTGAGISRNVLAFISAADEVCVVLTPEPTSITDAYGLIKILSKFKLHDEVSLIVNMVANSTEANQTVNKIQTVANNFLQINVKQLGYISQDLSVGKAVRKQQPFAQLYPKAKATNDINQIAQKIMGYRVNQGKGMDGFVNRLMRLFN